MRILCLGGSYFVASFRQLGHQVLAAHHEPDADICLDRPTRWQALAGRLGGLDFCPDFLLYSDNGNLPILLDPENVPCASVFYSIDTYCNPWHMSYAHGFDSVLVAQKDFVGLFSQESLDAAWLPLFCRHAQAAGQDADFGGRDLPVAFVGTIGHRNNPGRGPFLRNFRRLQPLVMLSGAYEPVFRRSGIVLNQTAFGELNFRCFEAMACGAALLMEQCGNGLADIFEPGENILPPYRRNDAAHAAGIAADWLARPQELARLATSGHRLVLAKHTDLVRAGTIIGLADRLLAGQAQRQRLEQCALRRKFVRVAFGIIASELMAAGSMEKVAGFYLRLASS